MERLEALLKGAIATGGGWVVFLMGGLDRLLKVLLVLMALDYLTGVLRAIHNRRLSSDIGAKGISKKVLQMCLVALAFVVGDLLGRAVPLREMVIMFFIANEGLSILENAAQAGVKFPHKLKGALIQLKGTDDYAETDSADQ